MCNVDIVFAHYFFISFYFLHYVYYVCDFYNK